MNPDKDVPNQILGLLSSFMHSRVILTAAELDIFSMLAASPRSASELAAGLGLDARATMRLLDCLVAFGLLAKQAQRYRPTPMGSVLSRQDAHSVRPLALHMNALWDRWGHLTRVLRGEKTQVSAAPGDDSDSESYRDFIAAMHAIGRSLADGVASAYPVEGGHHLLDIGGGSGTYTIAFLKHNPGLVATLFDLPQVIPLARKQVAEAGLDGRVSFASGDYLRDPMPRGCDLALLSAVIHQNSPAQNLLLYRKIHAALEPGGRILIRDHVMDPSRTHPVLGALFAINMLVNTEGGDTYTFEEIRQALEKAGFGAVRAVRQGEHMDSLVEGTKV